MGLDPWRLGLGARRLAMTNRLRRRHLLGGAMGLGAVALPPGSLPAQPAPPPAVSVRDGIPGEAPRYTGRALSAVPNEAAMVRRFWAPGLNEAYVPQGLTVLGDEILVAAYRSLTHDQADGPSRVFRLSRRDGSLRGSFALPEEFGHPGGLASDGRRLFAANSGVIVAFDATRLDAPDGPRPLSARRVDRSMGPAFLACDGQSLWFGPWRKSGNPRLHAVPVARFLEGEGHPVTPADAVRDIPLPLRAQGAAADAEGRIWIACSAGAAPGELHRLDPEDGTRLESHGAPGGIEDLGFDREGLLWSVSEAGSQRWNGWPTFFPLVFAMDVTRLR
ncbi:hypothetical protein RGI145_08280 [Roseomonas gilardii]|uniref:Gluconolactonase n=2 Tax=Roseomonas gilardii TaxID=257708 RepID=A0A1L7AEC1_9PROT|nr:hypothetical protein RGI145_08280 [Roseomonas gilardii]